MPASDEIHMVHPGSKLFHRTKPKDKRIPVAVSCLLILGTDLLIRRHFSIILLFLSPNGIAAIDPCHYKINGIRFLITMKPLPNRRNAAPYKQIYQVKEIFAEDLHIFQDPTDQ